LNRFQIFYRNLFFLCLVALAHSAHLPWWIDKGMIHSHCTLFRHYCFGYLWFCIVHGLFFGFIHDLLFTFWNFNWSVSFLCSRNWGSLINFLGSLSLDGLIYFFWSWLLNGTLWLIFLIILALILVCYRCFIISQWMVLWLIFRRVEQFWTDSWRTFVEGHICARVFWIVLCIIQRLVFLIFNRFVHRFKALNFDYFNWFFFYLLFG